MCQNKLDTYTTFPQRRKKKKQLIIYYIVYERKQASCVYVGVRCVYCCFPKMWEPNHSGVSALPKWAWGVQCLGTRSWWVWRSDLAPPEAAPFHRLSSSPKHQMDWLTTTRNPAETVDSSYYSIVVAVLMKEMSSDSPPAMEPMAPTEPMKGRLKILFVAVVVVVASYLQIEEECREC